MSDLKEWHRKVCERDNYVCQVCRRDFSYPAYFDENGVNQYVVGHHWLSRGAHIDRKFDISVGVCLCNVDHELVHRGAKHLPSETATRSTTNTDTILF